MTYIDLARARVYGDLIKESKTIRGIFKVRSGMTTTNGAEASSSSATVHVHPEDFDGINDIVGNGIVYNGADYEITGITEGRNFDNNQVEHYTLTLERANVAENGSQREIEDEFV